MNEIYTVQTITDENGDIVVPLPDTLVDEMGLAEGDTFDIEITPEGELILTLIPEEELDEDLIDDEEDE